MSKGKKTLLIVATALVVSGCAISFGAFAAAGFNPENLLDRITQLDSHHEDVPP